MIVDALEREKTVTRESRELVDAREEEKNSLKGIELLNALGGGKTVCINNGETPYG